MSSAADSKDAESLKTVLEFVQGTLVLSSCGACHEIGSDMEVQEAIDAVDDCSSVEDGVTVTLRDGSKYHVQVKRL